MEKFHGKQGRKALDWRIMNYEEARVYLDSVAKYGSVLGLENMRELLLRLGDPQKELKFIHISGTNGKGSVLAYLSTILKEAGYRVGRYISPTLFSYRERIQVNEDYINKESLAKHTEKIKEAIEGMLADGKPHPTQFEIETVLSFLYFLEQKCDVVVLETGLGGAEDATNIITTSILEVIVSISMDHMQFLGDTLEKIAIQKAGIIKKHTSVVSVLQEPEAMKVIEERVKEQECILSVADFRQADHIVYGLNRQGFSYGGYEDLEISLAGSYQIKNAVTAVEAVKALQRLGWVITEAALRNGLKNTRWRGRFTPICERPLMIMDGAHNPDGARMLKESIEQYFKGRRILYLCGVFRDKEYEKVIQTVAPYSEHMIAIATPGNPRALPAEELAAAAGKYIANVWPEPTIASAVKRAFHMADREDDVILAFGSLSFLGELERTVKEIKEKKSENGSGKN